MRFKKLYKAVSLNISSMKYAFFFISKYGRAIIYTMLCASVISIISSFIQMFIPALIVNSLEIENFMGSIIATIVFVLSTYVIGVVNGYIIHIKQNSINFLNKNLLNLILRKKTCLPYEIIETQEVIQSFDVAKKCIKDRIISNYAQSILNICTCIFIFIGVAYVVSSMPWWILIILLIVLIFNTIGNYLRANDKYEQFAEETQIERQLEYSRFWLTEQKRAKEVRTFILHDFVVEKLRFYNEAFFSLLEVFRKKQSNILAWTHLLELLKNISLYGYNVWLFYTGEITISTFILFMAVFFQFSRSLNNLITSFVDLNASNRYIQDLKIFLELVEDDLDDKNDHAIDLDGLYTIEFYKVSYKYPGQDTYTLKNVSFKVNPFEKISLVGPNGAGKTTLVNIMMGLYTPTEGSVLFNGLDIRKISKKKYLSYFSTVFQDYSVFDFSVSDNVVLQNNQDAERVLDSMQKIGLDNIPINTYVTQLYSGEGRDLSGGEKQKLAFARALYKNSQIFILDEPTSNLSPMGEYELYKRFNKLMEQKTVFFISHRLASCRLCDKILVLNNGVVDAFESHDVLIKQEGLYNDMFKAQSEIFT